MKTGTKTGLWAVVFWVLAGICSANDGVPMGYGGFLEWSAWMFFFGFVALGVFTICEICANRHY